MSLRESEERIRRLVEGRKTIPLTVDPVAWVVPAGVTDHLGRPFSFRDDQFAVMFEAGTYPRLEILDPRA